MSQSKLMAAKAAKGILVVFPEGKVDSVVRMLAAMRHLCQSEGLVFEDINRQAADLFAQEAEGWAPYPFLEEELELVPVVPCGPQEVPQVTPDVPDYPDDETVFLDTAAQEAWSNFPDPPSGLVTERGIEEWLETPQQVQQESPEELISRVLASIVQAAEQVLQLTGARLDLEVPSVAERFRWAVEHGRALIPQ